MEVEKTSRSADAAEGYIPGYRLLDGIYGALEVGMQDKQQAPCMRDRFDAEIYDGEDYYIGNDGIVFISDDENYDPGNHVICDLVETMGTSGDCPLKPVNEKEDT